jgi:hypothetical protein
MQKEREEQDALDKENKQRELVLRLQRDEQECLDANRSAATTRTRLTEDLNRINEKIQSARCSDTSACLCPVYNVLFGKSFMLYCRCYDVA